MQSHPCKQIYRCFISFLLSYVLILLSVSFAPTASANRERKEPSSTRRYLSVPAVQQNTARYRSGELLLRFRGGVTDQDKTLAIASQGARRKKQLRGESAIEELELTAGQNPETVAQQLRLNPAIEFAEPNFLINHDDLRLESKMVPATGQPRPLFEPTWLAGDPSLRNPGMAAIPQSQGT
ncbi:MAG: S8 family serine peptidase, partial [Pyrinomonadaceae bacterium]